MSRASMFRRRSSLISKASVDSPNGEFEFVERHSLPRNMTLNETTVDGGGSEVGYAASRKRNPLNDNIGTRDLATLPQLDEERLLRELKNRYENDLIYTNVGDILIAINPFKDLEMLYGEAATARYLHKSVPCNIPHVFRVSQLAYKLLLVDHRNQCCVISGESGAGKTETAKFLVEHLLATCQGKGTLEQKIMEVNPLLEAFGNAKTVINDNSSRFGKYLEIKFGFFGEVLGARLADYLLEKSRVVRQADGERNFHVFYYLFAGLDGDRRARLGLTDMLDFHYLRGGSQRVTKADAIDIDLADMKESFGGLMSCMSDIGFKANALEDLFTLLACILHIGNIEFRANERDTAAIVSMAPVKLVSSLLGVDEEDLASTFVSTYHLTRGERVVTEHTPVQAQDCRDAMAKALFGKLFAWIVAQANTLLAPQGKGYEEALSRNDGSVTEVGILDIFGFENFASNSFEQFCINIANEQLQFYFNQHIFALEQAEYLSEGIDISRVQFVDNKPCLDMIFMRPLGLLGLLDEESRFPKASDATLVEKFNSTSLKLSWPHYQPVDSKTIRLQTTARIKEGKKESSYFSIQHYAGRVIYVADQFLEKNRDTLSPNVVSILRSSEVSLLKHGFVDPLPLHPNEGDDKWRKASRTAAPGAGRVSVSAHFKNSLQDLMDKMLSAQPHFIRCVKPNHHKKPNDFDIPSVLQQLKYTGVLETTRIRRDGFSIRLPMADFVSRYGVLGLKLEEMPPRSASDEEKRTACLKLIKRANLKGSQIGKTLVFLKYYHSELLVRLMERAMLSATMMTKTVRRFLAVRLLRRLKEAKAKAEREAAQRALREKLEAERKAAEQARLEMEQRERERAEAERLATLKAMKQREEARLQAEKEKVAILERERLARAAEEKLQREAEEQARRDEEARIAEELRQEQAREEKRLKQQQYEETQRAKREQEERELKMELQRQEVQREVLTIVIAEEECDDMPLEEFENVFTDDLVADSEEREALMRARVQREAEERKRKRKLQEEFKLKQKRQQEENMVELKLIQERQRIEEEEKQRAIDADAAAAQERLKDLNFGSFAFSFGGSPPSAEPSTPVSKESIRPDKSEKRKSFFSFGLGKKASSTKLDSSPSIKSPSQSTLTKTPLISYPSFESPDSEKPVVSYPSFESPTASDPPMGKGNTLRGTLTKATSLHIEEEQVALPKPLASIKQPSRGTLTKSVSIDVVETLQSNPPPSAPLPQPPATIPSAPLLSSISSPLVGETLSDSITVAKPDKPEPAPKPRRELIRGRKKEENYLPGWKEAMTALEELDKFLDESLFSSADLIIMDPSEPGTGVRRRTSRTTVTPTESNTPTSPHPSLERAPSSRQGVPVIALPPPPVSSSTTSDQAPNSSTSVRRDSPSLLRAPSPSRVTTFDTLQGSPPTSRRILNPGNDTASKRIPSPVLNGSSALKENNLNGVGLSVNGSGPSPPVVGKTASPIPQNNVNGESAAPKPRRELVRGRKKEENYLPGWKEAMTALEELDQYLDSLGVIYIEGKGLNTLRGTMRGTQSKASPAVRAPLPIDMMSPNSSDEPKKEDFLRRQVTTWQQPGTARKVPAPLLTSSSDDSILSNPKIRDESPRLRANTFNSPKLTARTSELRLSKVKPNDFAQLDEASRIALLTKVRDGALTIDQALAQVPNQTPADVPPLSQSPQTQNCTIS